MVSRRCVRDTLVARSRRVRLYRDVNQHADHERPQLLQRMKARDLARDQMLDTAVIRLVSLSELYGLLGTFGDVERGHGRESLHARKLRFHETLRRSSSSARQSQTSS